MNGEATRRARKWALAIAVAVAITLVASTAVLAQGPAGWGRGFGSSALEAIAEFLGIDAEKLSAELWGGRTLAELADRFGVDLSGLYEAARSAQEEAIERAVEEGTLTEEQAERLLKRLGDRPALAIPRLGRWGGWFGRFAGGATEESLAEALGLDVEELRLQLWGGRTLAELADRAGVDLEDVREAVEAGRREALRERIAQAVEEGSITEEQAGWLLEGLDAGYLGDGFGLSMKGAPWDGFGGPGAVFGSGAHAGRGRMMFGRR